MIAPPVLLYSNIILAFGVQKACLRFALKADPLGYISVCVGICYPLIFASIISLFRLAVKLIIRKLNRVAIAALIFRIC